MLLRALIKEDQFCGQTQAEKFLSSHLLVRSVM